jgi:hypothetical protein
MASQELEWNQRNELKLPLGSHTKLDKINLDLDTPRIKAAMRNLGFKPSDLVIKPLNQFVAEDLSLREDIALIRYEALKRNFLNNVN